MGTEGKEIHNKEILEATMFLEKEVIPKFAVEFTQKFEREREVLTENLKFLGQINATLHRSGTFYNSNFLLKFYRN
jgi:hypothetical protein